MKLGLSINATWVRFELSFIFWFLSTFVGLTLTQLISLSKKAYVAYVCTFACVFFLVYFFYLQKPVKKWFKLFFIDLLVVNLAHVCTQTHAAYV